MSQERYENRQSPLSAIILTLNEECTLPRCLESLRGLRCPTFVVDSGSSDRTVQIAESAGALVVEHDFENYAAQRNWAQENLTFQNDWVLHLDADEYLTPELVEEINQVLQDPAQEIKGFLLCRRTVFMDRWIKHGGHYPSYHLRLFRKGLGQCEDRLYDQHFLVKGRVGRLQHDFLNVLNPDLSTWVLRHGRWAELEARELLSGVNGANRVLSLPFGNPIERRRWRKERVYLHLPLFARAFLYWFYRYFMRLGFLDGKEGLIFHFLQACWFRFLVDCHLYQLRNPSSKQGKGLAEP